MVCVAFVGLGWVARRVWIPAFHQIESCTALAGCDPSEAARDAVRDAWPRMNVSADLPTLFESKPDLIVIGTPNKTHVPIAEEALRRGVSVLIEKPVCTGTGELSRLRQVYRMSTEAGSRPVIFASAGARHRADVRLLHAKIAEGVIGVPRRVSCRWIRGRGIPRAGSWFTDISKSGGGAGWDLGWHMTDVALSLLGFPAAIGAIGLRTGDFIGSDGFGASWKAGEAAETAGIDVEDNLRGAFIAEGGVFVDLHVAWASHERIDVTSVEIEGSAGSLRLLTTFGFSPNRVATPEIRLMKRGIETLLEIPNEAPEMAYVRQARSIVCSLSDEAQRPARDETLDQVAAVIKPLELMYMIQ